MKTLETLRVGGFVPFTTVDYPSRLSAVVFCQGCPWRCRYCHNPHLQPFVGTEWVWENIVAELTARRGFLEAVVFSGGEPTAQPVLAAAMRDVRDMGFAVGLHTAGIFPQRLEEVLPLVDWVGLDIKAPLDARYSKITRHPGSQRVVSHALDSVRRSGVAFELRTTVHPILLGTPDLEDLAEDLRRHDVPGVKIQPFRAEGCVDAELLAGAHSRL